MKEGYNINMKYREFSKIGCGNSKEIEVVTEGNIKFIVKIVHWFGKKKVGIYLKYKD